MGRKLEGRQGKSIKKLFGELSADFPDERRMYTARLVCFLLIQQHLSGKSAQGIVAECANFKMYREFYGECSRKSSGHKLSTNTSGYIQAKQALPKERLFELYEKLFATIQDKPDKFQGRRVFVVDGTELKLPPRAHLREKYPPSSNSFGKTTFPRVRVSAVHDAYSGLAYAPNWSASSGDDGRGEVSLALEQMPGLEEGSIIVGDRNYGIFSFCYETDKMGLKPIVRLTEQREEKILKDSGIVGKSGFDVLVNWKVSRKDLQSNPEYSKDLMLSGRIIRAWVKKEGEEEKQLITLFTTLEGISPEQVVELYGLRWNIEHDIRDLKKTCDLDELSSVSVESIEKEILAAILAYNLVRAVMIMAAQEHGLQPRQISFKLAYDLLRTTAGGLLIFSKTAKEQDEYFSELLQALASAPLPKRKPRNYRRESYPKPSPFPERRPKT